jgi:fructoselysine-6-P-deglycase FrlB-like protein
LLSGINFPVAIEGALKLKEISYIHAESHPAGEAWTKRAAAQFHFMTYKNFI